MTEQGGDATLRVWRAWGPALINDGKEVRPFAEGVGYTQATYIYVEAQLFHVMRRAGDELVLGEARYAQIWCRMTKEHVTRVRAALDGETNAIVELGHHVVVHERGVMGRDVPGGASAGMDGVCLGLCEVSVHLGRRRRWNCNTTD